MKNYIITILSFICFTSCFGQVSKIGDVLIRETIQGVGRLPTIAVDAKDRPHIIADGGISRAGINVFDKIDNGTWINSTFDSSIFGSTQFFNPSLEITSDGKAFCAAIVFGSNVGAGSILRTNMNTDLPSDPKAGYSVRRIQGPWDAGESSIDFSLYDQFIISSSFGRARIYTFDSTQNGYIRELEYRQMFSGNGGEKNAFWVSKAKPQQHKTTGLHGVWHGVIGGYNRYDSSYQNSINHENGDSPIAWASFTIYPIMEDDGTYVDVKSDNVEAERAYMTSAFAEAGVCVNIYDPKMKRMIFSAYDLLVVDIQGSSGLRRFAPQIAPAKNGGAFISWTSRGGVYVRFISTEGIMGEEFRVGDGARANICTDSNGDLHVVYSNGNLQYVKIKIHSYDPNDILYMFSG